MLKQLNVFHSQRSTLPEEARAKFCLSTTFGLSFMINSVAPTRSSTFNAYLITKVENRNLSRFLGSFSLNYDVADTILQGNEKMNEVATAPLPVPVHKSLRFRVPDL